MAVVKTEKILKTRYQQGSVELVAEFDKMNDRLTIKQPDWIYPQIQEWSAAKLADFIACITEIQTDTATEL